MAPYKPTLLLKVAVVPTIHYLRSSYNSTFKSRCNCRGYFLLEIVYHRSRACSDFPVLPAVGEAAAGSERFRHLPAARPCLCPASGVSRCERSLCCALVTRCSTELEAALYRAMKQRHGRAAAWCAFIIFAKPLPYIDSRHPSCAAKLMLHILPF